MNQQHLFFINYNDTKIGFVQIYKYDGKKSDKLRKYDSIFEYDIFIGESEYLSRGIGCEYVIVDVFAYNEIGKKFYNKKNYHTRMETMIKKI